VGWGAGAVAGAGVGEGTGWRAEGPYLGHASPWLVPLGADAYWPYRWVRVVPLGIDAWNLSAP
jgi:hypothetical protein